MLISWPLLATNAIFFASWLKPALPNGGWFQVLTLSNASFFIAGTVTGKLPVTVPTLTPVLVTYFNWKNGLTLLISVFLENL